MEVLHDLVSTIRCWFEVAKCLTEERLLVCFWGSYAGIFGGSVVLVDFPPGHI